MGGLFGALGEAVGAGQVKNGFNGPKLPFGNSKKAAKPAPASGSQETSIYSLPIAQPHQGSLSHYQTTYTQCDLHGGDPPPYSESTSPPEKRLSHRYYAYSAHDSDQPSSARPSPGDPFSIPPQQRSGAYQYQSPSHDSNVPSRQQEELNRLRNLSCPQPSRGSFRPLALPQVAFGGGQPFLRGYSEELLRFGISEADLIMVIDALNVAIVPNPEIALGQKAAGIAGWFVPGFGAIGMMAGQVGVGVGAALGHASIVNKVLSKANLEIFVPRGLEICIAKTKNVDEEVGRTSSLGKPELLEDTSPESHISSYGDLLAPLSIIRPSLDSYGRTDPLAVMVKRMNKHSSKSKIQRAREEMERGDSRELERLERHLKWVMVRRASPNAVLYWQQTLEQSNNGMESEQHV